MKRIRLLMFVCCCLLGWTQAFARDLAQPYFESVPGTESIANGIVTCLAQDSRGLIWFGTTEGLLQFDGYRLRQYRYDRNDPSSLGDDYVRALLPRADGSLWVATQSGGISRYLPEQDRFQHFRHDPADPHSLAHDGPVVLADADGRGDVWIGFSADGLDRWDAASGRFEHFRADPADPDALAHPTVRSLLVDRRGDLWAGTVVGLQRLRAGEARFERIGERMQDGSPGLAGQYVYHLYEAEDGRIWVGTQAHGAAIVDPLSLQLQRIAVGGEGLAHAWVDGFVEAAPGRMWIATFGAGVDVYDVPQGRIVDRIRNDPALPGTLALDRVVAPLRDRSGLVWLGTWGGGLQWHNPGNAEAFRVYRHSPNRPEGLSHASVLSLLELEDGRLWIGTDGNGIDVFDRRSGLVGGYRPAPGDPHALQDGTIRSLATTPDGMRWIGTQQAGLFRFDPASERFSPVDLGTPDRRVPHLHVGSDGYLWLGAQRGLARLDPRDQSVQFLSLASGERFADAVWVMSEDADGNLWVGTPNALLLKPAGEMLLRTPPPGREDSPTAVMDLWLDRGGRLWTIGPAGIHRSRGWKDGWPQFEPWGQGLQQLDPSFGRQWRADAQGRLWTPRFLIDPEQGTAIAHGRADGAEIGNVDIGARISSRDGALIFGGTRGVLVIQPQRFQPWRFQPQLIATGLEIDGEQLSLGALAAGLQLRPEQGRLSLEFAALDYAAPAQNRYAYRLEGLDPGWIETSAERRLATYNNLWPGDYRLQVRASGRSGEWSPHTLEIPLRVLPAWWQTWWFATLVLLACALLAYLAVARRTARIRASAAQLRQLVEQRTAELSVSKQRAERALDELKGAQRQLVAAEKMASLGQLVAGVAHEINTPIGIAVTAASHLQEASREAGEKIDSGKLTKRELNEWRATLDEATRLILGSLARANTLISSFKRVSVDQSSEQRRRFDLQQFLGEVQVSLQPTYKRSAHQLGIDCAPGIELDTYPGALFQILTNFINNALMHAFAEGQAGQMRIEAEPQGERVRIRFADDGVGMPSEVVARAFDPFFTTRRGSGGSGLGLHLVYNLVTQLLGGSIELRSRPGAGTEFLIEIPRIAPQRAEPAQS